MFKLKKFPEIASGTLPKVFILINVVITLFYFSWWFSFDQVSQPFLYALLFIGEIYHVVMVLLFWFTIRRLNEPTPALPQTDTFQPSIDVFVTVAGEPVEVIRQTVESILQTKYKQKKVYILNDSYVAGYDSWRDYEVLAKELGIHCITRKIAGGAKAGNINHALRKTKSELIAIFDADMSPAPDFFTRTVNYFTEDKIGFVQTPQYYANHEDNTVTTAAWEQQEFFFGPVLRGKQSSNAAFICGTNVIIRRTALEGVGGMNETSIAEDFLTSLLIHQQGWKSIYVPDVLAQGLAPGDLQSYYKQQLRWARGSLEVLFKHNPLLIKNLTWPQRLEYLSSTFYYCNGLIVAIDAIVPIFFLLFGISPIQATTTVFALYFLPFMGTVIFSLHQISQKSLTFRAISFTQSSWFLQIQAFVSALTGKKMGFAVTSKEALEGNFFFLAYPHLVYVAVAVLSSLWAIFREGLSPSVITNIAWVMFNVLLFVPYILAAVPNRKSLNKPAVQYA